MKKVNNFSTMKDILNLIVANERRGFFASEKTIGCH